MRWILACELQSLQYGAVTTIPNLSTFISNMDGGFSWIVVDVDEGVEIVFPGW